ncbi:MAG: UV DNA damage repair endonuclease UvsE [Promethearchaeota archaeon]|nr:MAG: UV DNA damage repair endonuclease UvsE [Candidatus Lokiarchaeota archaeon]
MKIGYPCINLSLECRSSKTFRLKNYSKEKLIETVDGNLRCLFEILEYNNSHNLLFFRITSDLIPFGSHPILNFDWQNYFKENFRTIGKFIKQKNMRISMHPGQYTVLNSKNQNVFENSIKDLEYHVDVLDLLELNRTAKVQIHVGGVYKDKKGSLERFKNRYLNLDERIKNRLIIENDDKSYNLNDCLDIYYSTGIPIVFDVYHHECNPSGKSLIESFKLFTKTWEIEDGKPIVHYSSEHLIKGKSKHADTIDLNNFKKFFQTTKDFDFDIMLEIKDKENSALKALKILTNDSRFNTNL